MWVERRNGDEISTTCHPALTEVTKDTFGVIVYQEQVLNIIREVGNLSWDDANSIRKAMSGSLGEEFFNKFGARFIKGAMAKHGMAEDTATEIWESICTMGNWSFNKSHAVSYGLMSYYCCYLKAHFPLEFAAATLDAEDDVMRQIHFLRELHEEGIHYTAMDIERSGDRWSVDKENMMLIGPLTNIKGVGPATMQEIMDCRANGKPIRQSVIAKLEGAQTAIDSLFPIADAVRRILPDLKQANIHTKPTPIIRVQAGQFGKYDEVLIIGKLTKLGEQDMNEEVRVQRRGYKIKGKSMTLNINIADDTDEIFCKINISDYDRLAPKMIERGGVGKAIYAVKGTVPKDFRMVSIKQIRFIGYMGD